MKKLGKIQKHMLYEILRCTHISLHYRTKQAESYGNYAPKLASHKRTCESLNNSGFIVRIGSSYELTGYGWEVLNTSPYKILIQEAEKELQYALDYQQSAKESDRPSYSEWTVNIYRELYKNPSMSALEVQRLERERVFNNRINHEAEIQCMEHKLARIELAATLANYRGII